MLVLASVAALQSVSNSTTAFGRFGDDFKPLSKSMLTNGEMLFTQLRMSQVATVRTTPLNAVHVAEASYGAGRGSKVVLVSLGGYIDKNRIVHDWIGTKSLVPKATPSYIVRIFEPQVETVGPSKNHYWNVIVNARNRRIISTFTYN